MWSPRLPILKNSTLLNTKKQRPTKTKSCNEKEYVNEIKKVPEQNFGAYEGH